MDKEQYSLYLDRNNSYSYAKSCSNCANMQFINCSYLCYLIDDEPMHVKSNKVCILWKGLDNDR